MFKLLSNFNVFDVFKLEELINSVKFYCFHFNVFELLKFYNNWRNRRNSTLIVSRYENSCSFNFRIANTEIQKSEIAVYLLKDL